MNFNAKDAKECAKEREGRSCSANFARTFATYAVKLHTLKLDSDHKKYTTVQAELAK